MEECCGIDADHSRAARSGTFRNPAEKAGTLMSHSDNQRPWPAPARPWAMRMRWCDLLFAHWRVEPAALRRLIPGGLELDLFDGHAYVGAVPFTMEGVSRRLVPDVPGLHRFPELNLRTYVKAGGKPSVWFFSLDAGQRLAVRVARQFFHLPYFDAKFQIDHKSESVEFSAVRTHRGAPKATFAATYQPIGPVYHSARGSLDSWLTDRYCLSAVDSAGNLYRGEIDHDRWPLQPAVGEVEVNTLGDWLGIEMKGPPVTLHFAKSLEVRAWSVERT